MENRLLRIIPKSPFSFDFMRQNRLISFLSHELDVKKHFGFRRKFVTLCVINSQKQMRFLHSCKDEFCWLFYLSERRPVHAGGGIYPACCYRKSPAFLPGLQITDLFRYLNFCIFHILLLLNRNCPTSELIGQFFWLPLLDSNQRPCG